MKTRITELFGIEHPIIQGGMHFVGFLPRCRGGVQRRRAGASSPAHAEDADLLASEIRRCREMTDKPFGVNLTFLPTVSSPGLSGYIQAIIDGGVKAVETAGNNPQKWMPAAARGRHQGDPQVHLGAPLLKAESIGCDAVSVDGFECGGTRRGRRAQLHPAAARRRGTQDPLRRLGRHGRRRSLVAALALGAEGMNMGTRFIATKEAPVHDNVKQAILAASELDTRLVVRPCATPSACSAIPPPTPAGKERARRGHQVRGHHRAGGRRLSEDHARWRHGRRRLVLRHGRGLIHDVPPSRTDRPHHGPGRGHHPQAPGRLRAPEVWCMRHADDPVPRPRCAC